MWPRCARSPTMSGRLAPELLQCDCARDGPSDRVARVGVLSVEPCAPLPHHSVLLVPPPDSRAGSQTRWQSGSEAGECRASAGGNMLPACCRQTEVGAMPHGTEICSGVGRVARRARLAAKPFSRPLPRLTLWAGSPTSRRLACFSCFKRKLNRNTGYL